MGDWYVQAGRFSFLEKDVFNGVESYTWNAKKNRIDIDFSYNQGSFTGPIKKAPQKGWVLDTNTNAWWKVSPLWPLKFDYLVIALADDYSWTAIGVPNEKYLWIMSREPHFSKDKTAEILKEIEGEGYDISNIVHVQHNPKP
jgi:apolipoprotein D and lipocalin family protein